MCIIVYKPKNVKMIDLDTLKTCMENNPDGSGYMFNISDGVFIKKGFWSAPELLKSLETDVLKYYKNVSEPDIAIHCRISTAGLTKNENCHPFPISEHVGRLQSTFLITDRAIVHNGMINIEDPEHKNLSDTQIFVKDILSKIDLLNPINDLLIRLAIGSSKMLFFDNTGKFKSIGQWIEDQGIYYSNNTYKSKKYSYSYYDYDNYYKDYNSKWNSKKKKNKSFPIQEDTFNCCCCLEIKNLDEECPLFDDEKSEFRLKEDEKICFDCYKEFFADDFYLSKAE